METLNPNAATRNSISLLLITEGLSHLILCYGKLCKIKHALQEPLHGISLLNLAACTGKILSYSLDRYYWIGLTTQTPTYLTTRTCPSGFASLYIIKNQPAH